MFGKNANGNANGYMNADGNEKANANAFLKNFDKVLTRMPHSSPFFQGFICYTARNG